MARFRRIDRAEGITLRVFGWGITLAALLSAVTPPSSVAFAGLAVVVWGQWKCRVGLFGRWRDEDAGDV